ncbi:MAG: hypothetical protein Q9217_003161 [Psora testacea]
MRAWYSAGRAQLPEYRQWRSLSSFLRLQNHAKLIPSNEELLSKLNDITSDNTTTSTAGPQAADDQSQNGASDQLRSPASKLPQSPLTDPVLNAARFGHKKAKPRPDLKKLSGFQLRLKKNPYAHALASPLRYCLLTGARLPKHFLLDFGLATHPETGAKWHLPRLTAELAEENNDAKKASPLEQESAGDGESDSPDEDNPKLSQQQKQDPVPSPAKQLPPRTISGTHFLSSYAALKRVSKLGPAQYRNLMPYRWKEESVIKLNEIVWREDMAEFTLELMRKRAVQGLERCVGLRSGYVVECESWETVRWKQQGACVLWMGRGSEHERKMGDEEGMGGKEASSLPPYAVVMYHGKNIAVYNLPTLLGREHLGGLRGKFPKVLGEELAVVRRKNLTVQLQMDLWKLMSYLADSERQED